MPGKKVVTDKERKIREAERIKAWNEMVKVLKAS
jgi:hypothetical protein